MSEFKVTPKMILELKEELAEVNRNIHQLSKILLRAQSEFFAEQLQLKQERKAALEEFLELATECEAAGH